MNTVNNAIKTGEDLIMHAGSALWKDHYSKRTFTLADPLVRDAYEKTYCCFAASLPKNRCYPFSREAARSPEELNIDPNKGMLLMGNTGVGMTTLFQIMAEVFMHTERAFERVDPFGFGDAFVAINMVSKDHVYTSAQLQEPVYTGINDMLNIYGRCLLKDLLIDDTEIFMSRDKHSRIVKGLIYQREEIFPLKKTHLCISFSAEGDNPEQYAREMLLKAYGEHVYSRITSMFNIVLWPGKSFRTGKKD